MTNIRKILGSKIPKNATHYMIKKSRDGGNDAVCFFKQNPLKQSPEEMKGRKILSDVQQIMLHQNFRSQETPFAHWQYDCMRKLFPIEIQ